MSAFILDTWLAFAVMAGIAVIWTAGCMCVGIGIERWRKRVQRRRQAEALRELSRLSRNMREEL